MNCPISDRLLACCGFIAPGVRIADIGCDHGYLGIHLLLTNIASFVYACDINCQPLNAARKNAQKYSVADKMNFYLTDGAKDVPHDFDVLICAGMGADTIISVLENSRWLQSDAYQLVLQCQSKSPMLRKYLSENGWQITQEKILRDKRFLYTVMNVTYTPCRTLTPGECFFPPALSGNDQTLLSEYYRSVVQRLQRNVIPRGEDANAFYAEALKELEAFDIQNAHWGGIL